MRPQSEAASSTRYRSGAMCRVPWRLPRCVVRQQAARAVFGRYLHGALAATLMIGLMIPTVVSAGIFSFTRTDYLLDSYLNGLDSVAVGDLDGVNGPDIVVLSYTA